MPAWIILGAAALLAVLFIIVRRLKAYQNQEAVLMGRMRSSVLYSRLKPMLEKCSEYCIESVLIRPEEVRIVLYRPMNRAIRFCFEEHGLDPVDQPQTLLALTQAVSLDIPALGDPAKYYFSTHTAPRDGGGVYRWYSYNVQLDHKDRMLRAWYDQQAPEEGIIR